MPANARQDLVVPLPGKLFEKVFVPVAVHEGLKASGILITEALEQQLLERHRPRRGRAP